MQGAETVSLLPITYAQDAERDHLAFAQGLPSRGPFHGLWSVDQNVLFQEIFCDDRTVLSAAMRKALYAAASESSRGVGVPCELPSGVRVHDIDALTLREHLRANASRGNFRLLWLAPGRDAVGRRQASWALRRPRYARAKRREHLQKT